MVRNLQPRVPLDDDDDAPTSRREEDDSAARQRAAHRALKSRLILPDDTVETYGYVDPKHVRQAQKSGRLAAWKGAHRDKAILSFVSGQADRARRKFGQSVYVGGEASSLVLTIPVPSLAFEFLIAQNGFPLGLIFQLVSETGIGKSALLAEFGRWFMGLGGMFSLLENETKFNDKWYRSILGPELFERVLVERCDSVEDWQARLTFLCNDTKHYMIGTKKEPGPGRVFPWLAGIDSIMGKQSMETAEKILGARTKSGERGQGGEGYADRGHPIEALKITRYLKSFPSELDNWPFALVLVNHLKLNRNKEGNEERNKSGGKHVDFQESFEIELTKIGGPRKMIQCREFEGYPVGISCWKNSFGPGKRRIQTRLLWWFEDDHETGKWVQRTVWDWDWSTVWLLHQVIEGEKTSPLLRQSLKEADFHLDCPSTAEIENLAWSKSLGMTKGDAASWSEVGARIRQDRALMKRLRVALRINERPRFKGDYLERLDALSGKAT